VLQPRGIDTEHGAPRNVFNYFRPHLIDENLVQLRAPHLPVSQASPHLWPTSFETLSRRRRAIRFGLPSSPARDVLVPHRGDEEFKNPGAAYLWRFRPSFQLFRLHILSYYLPISRFCPSGDASYGEWAIKPDGR
tara:strand:- start:627 stop:1031 length:405 start_codon:yes stop_codon:yes gene_type:complete